MEWVKVREFQAHDSAGNIIVVEIWDEQRVLPARFVGTIPRRLQLPDGRGVEVIADGRYLIVDTGEELTSDDPAAA